MSERTNLLESIANTIKDYRAADCLAGRIAAPTPAHVNRWVNQFDADVQLPLLRELDHVLKSTYIDKATVLKFLAGLLSNAKLAGPDPCSFWKDVKFLNIQGGGNSQREMLSLFDALLFEQCGLRVAECGANPKAFFYLDDAVFTGNRVLNDLRSWIQTTAPKQATVHIVTIAYHRGGKFYADGKVTEAAAAAGKEVALQWWRCVELEDTKTHINTSDVLRPRSLPDDKLVEAYAASLKYPPVFRTQASRGEHEFFSSEEGRHVLEQELLKAGAKIRNLCPLLGQYQRPLGNMILQTLGFGSTIVTFRNCPNNAPLAFWAGDPWYPLFPRKTN